MTGLSEIVYNAGVLASCALFGKVYSGPVGCYSAEEGVWGSDVVDYGAGLVGWSRIGACFGLVKSVSGAHIEIRDYWNALSIDAVGALNAQFRTRFD